ncbi:MAG: ATP-dependent DNA helicase RecQ [Proteobacteria bacterium]|nr:MAG: ATP-dependent DNA helicase RecQ [Pseudomonadota bacterium]
MSESYHQPRGDFLQKDSESSMQPVVETYKNPVTNSLFEQLAQRVGIGGFHEFQKQAIAAVNRGRDICLVVPTGSGKSLCYIAPSLFLPGLVLVVSPLIALMRDQQKQLRELNIPSISFDSHLSPDEKKSALKKIARQEIKILYISPERLALPGFREMLKDIPISLIAIDEAHCVQQWGQGFRPEYARLGQYLSELNPCPKMALTATLTPRERKEVVTSLGMNDPQFITMSCIRENLELNIFHYQNKEMQSQSVLESVVQREDQGIVYASTRKNVEEIYRSLKARKVAAGMYHGGMLSEQRQRMQDDFMAGKIRVMVATKAFGMGINLPMIRYVVHANMPCSIESYTQEIGRAGRDGYHAVCDLHYGPKDYFLQKFMIEKSYPSEKDLPRIWAQIEDNFQGKRSYHQGHLISDLSVQTMLPRETIDAAFEFFVKEDALKVIETVSEEDNYLHETHVVLSENFLGLNKLLQGLREQVAWRFEKLNAMHKLIKGSSSPKNTIEQYFQ